VRIGAIAPKRATLSCPLRSVKSARLAGIGTGEQVNRGRQEDDRVPDEKLAIAERIWFGGERPFMSALEAWRRLEDELERGEMQPEAERSAVCPLDLGHRGWRHRYTWECRPPTPRLGDWIVVYGTRFRKDGIIGKLKKTFSLRFESEKTNATK
jgi:hypothetical protein